ncbi:MAG: protein translocase subunit SecF [Gemmatimonadetes bacterium]|nr:protein translocase subunit SecF [Gemmatimonadota bacterium]
MIRVFASANYDFIGLRRTAYVLSAALILPGLLLMLARGLNYSIEFTGGTLVQVTLSPGIDAGQVRQAVTAGGLVGAEIQNFGSDREFVIRARLGLAGPATEQEAQRTAEQVSAALTQRFGADAFTVQRVEAVGPKVGGELRQKALGAILLSFLATLVYLAFRFEWRFGVAAVLATGHDILATIVFTRYLDLEVSLVVVSAILTVIGYSLNDTIVIFDRVRENLRKYKRDDFTGILNRSVNETLPRTVLTGGATLMALLAMLFLAGEIIRPFAWVMAFGIFTGTFSSMYIASPILLAIEKRWPGAGARGVKATVAPAGAAPPGIAAS